MTNEELAVKAQAGDRAAHRQLWECTRWLCCHIARRYFPLCEQAGMERADLEQCLYLGFCAAVSAFKPDSGNRFTTYLTFPVRNACKAALGIRNGEPMRPRPVSLQSPAGEEDDGTELQDLIAAENSMGPQEGLENRLYLIRLRALLESLLDELPEQEAAVLRARFFDERTRRETSDILGCTLCEVGALEGRGLRRLRKPRYLRQLEQYHEHSAPSHPPC